MTCVPKFPEFDWCPGDLVWCDEFVRRDGLYIFLSRGRVWPKDVNPFCHMWSLERDELVTWYIDVSKWRMISRLEDSHEGR